MDDLSEYIGTQQISPDITETSVTLQKTLYLLVNNVKKLLKLGENTIGRSEDSDVCFPQDTVSYHHAIIECEADDFYVKDLNSTNHTKRDGKTMKPYVVYELKSGSQLTFGDVEAVFHAIDDEQTLVPATAQQEKEKDRSSENCKTRMLNTFSTSASIQESLRDENSSAHDVEDQNVSHQNKEKHVYDLETQQSSTTNEDSIYDLETQVPSPLKSNKKQNIYDLETQPPFKLGSNQPGLYDQETQKSPPHLKEKNIYDLETQKPLPLKSKKNLTIYEVETQRAPSDYDSSSDKSQHHLSDSDADEKLNKDKNIPETNHKSKKKTKKTKFSKPANSGDTSSDEESEMKITRKSKISRNTVKTGTIIHQKSEKSLEESVDDIESKDKDTKEPSKQIRDIKDGFISESEQNDKNTFEDSVLANINSANDTNSESFIGMVPGKNKRFIVCSSSDSDSENKNRNTVKQQSSDLSRNKSLVNTTYDVQNSIDEIYCELGAPGTPTEETQFIHEVRSTQEVVKNNQEQLESQFVISDNEEDDAPLGSPNLLAPESQSLLSHENFDTEASSKNTTNYDISEMELDSSVVGLVSKDNKVPIKKEKNISNSLENSSSMFSVSETEIRPDFIQENINDVNLLVKETNIDALNEDSCTRSESDFEMFDKKNRAKEEKNCAVVKKVEEETSKAKNVEKNCITTEISESKSNPNETKDNPRIQRSRKAVKRKVSEHHDSSSTESEFDFIVTEKNKHDTIEANDTATSTRVNEKNNKETVKLTGQNIEPVDFFDIAIQKVSVAPSETDESFIVPTPKENLDENFFQIATQIVSIAASETEESFIAPTEKENLNENFFAAATQEVSIVPGETEESFIAPAHQKKFDENFFEAATQEVSIVPSETDESFVGPSQKNSPVNSNFFEAAAQKNEPLKVNLGPINENADFFDAATQQVSFDANIKNNTNEDESTDEDFFHIPTREVTGVVKKDQPEKRAKTYIHKKATDSESLKCSDENIKIGKKYTNKRKKAKNADVTQKKSRPNKEGNEQNKKNRNDSESSNFSDDYKEVGKNKVNKIIKETKSGSSKKEPKLYKYSSKQKNQDRNDSEFSCHSNEDEGVEKYKVNTNKEKEPDEEERVVKGQADTGGSSNKGVRENMKCETIKALSDNVESTIIKSKDEKVTKTPVKKGSSRIRKKDPKYKDTDIEDVRKIGNKILHNQSEDSRGDKSKEKDSNTTDNSEKYSEESKITRSTRGRKKIVNNDMSETNNVGKSNVKADTSPKTTPVKNDDINVAASETGGEDKISAQPRTPSRKRRNDKVIADERTSPEPKCKNTSKKKTKNSDDTPVTDSKPCAGESSVTVVQKKGKNRQHAKREKESTSVEDEHSSPVKITVKRGGKEPSEKETKSKGSPSKKRAKKKEEIEAKPNDTSSSEATKGNRTTESSKVTSDKPATKRKDSHIEEESNMKAPSTPKRRRGGKELLDVAVRCSPIRRSNARQRSSSSSSESIASDSTASTERRHKLSMSSNKNPETKVTFTMIDNPTKYSTLLSSLNASITENPLTSDILVTKKVARSLKFLMFLALGKPIVSLKWLTDSEKSMKFMPHEKYMLRDGDAEKTYGFSLERSIAIAKETKLLENYSVFVTNSVKPAPADMKSIVECSGGTFLSKVPSKWAPYSIIITDPGDLAQLKKILAVSGAKPCVANKEFILSGILQQKLDFVKHKVQV